MNAQLVPRDRPMPIAFAHAVKAIADCQLIDEAKEWDGTAQAWEGWAKFYNDDAVMREAKLLRLWAYRRMGILARREAQLARAKCGKNPGAVTLLVGHGIGRSKALTMSKIGGISDDVFAKALTGDKIPAPVSLVQYQLKQKPELSMFSYRLSGLKSELKKELPLHVVRSMTAEERARYVESVTFVSDWLAVFLREIHRMAPDRARET